MSAYEISVLHSAPCVHLCSRVPLHYTTARLCRTDGRTKMAKGSQLSQLKSALSQAGFVKQQQNGKKRKRTPLDEKEKEKKAAKLRDIQQKMNPFDVKVTKLKHDVGGRKIAGTMGRPAQSKQAGIEQVHAVLKSYIIARVLTSLSNIAQEDSSERVRRTRPYRRHCRSPFR